MTAPNPLREGRIAPERVDNVSMSSQTGGRKRGAVRTAEFDIDEARKAFFLMVGFIALIWVLQIFNWAGHYRLDYDYGILPRNIGRLPQIFSAPFLHFSWDHIEGNSGPLFVFGLLAAYRGVKKFLGVTLIVAVTSGLAVWLFQGGTRAHRGGQRPHLRLLRLCAVPGRVRPEPHRRTHRAGHGAVLRLHPDRGDTGDARRELDRPPGRADRRDRLGLDLPDQAHGPQDGPGQGSRRPRRPSARHHGRGTRG